ncbi:MAG: glycosyltransferase family 2 protein, partial [Candidatus Levybacteria bacterium]|nr:glycosyltransferase family 2 protein [Candidatus Levybacteria bacterium]
MKKVAIVIVHYSGVRNTTQCLQSIEKLQITNYKLQIIVVDNNPKEQFTVDNSQLTDTVKIIKSNENLGFSGGNNVGSDEKIGIVVPKIYFAKGYEFHKDRYKKGELGKVIWYAGGIIDWDNVVGKHRGVDEVDNGQYDQVEPTEFASGCCFLVKIEVFEKVGFFDEKYFLYYEDADLSMRINKAGHAIMYVPKAILWHKNAGAAGGSGSTLQDYYITRNRLIFGMRYAPLRSKLALIKQSVH